MNSQLSIKIDFQQNRPDPSEIFEAMASYIKFHTDIGQILLNSINEKADFKFELADIERSSLLAKLNPIGLKDKIRDFYIKFSNETVYEILEAGEEITDNDINRIADELEEKINRDFNPQMPAIIKPPALASAVKHLSAANSKVNSEEPVSFSNSNSNVIRIDTRQRFTKNSEEKETNKTHKETLLLNVISGKNEGNAAWTFRSRALNQKFNAHISDHEWLARYQAQIIPPIGPKDALLAKVEYKIDEIENKIIGAKIISINEIRRAEKQSSLKYE